MGGGVDMAEGVDAEAHLYRLVIFPRYKHQISLEAVFEVMVSVMVLD